jgi:hypothetical protein
VLYCTIAREGLVGRAVGSRGESCGDDLRKDYLLGMVVVV